MQTLLEVIATSLWICQRIATLVAQVAKAEVVNVDA